MNSIHPYMRFKCLIPFDWKHTLCHGLAFCNKKTCENDIAPGWANEIQFIQRVLEKRCQKASSRMALFGRLPGPVFFFFANTAREFSRRRAHVLRVPVSARRSSCATPLGSGGQCWHPIPGALRRALLRQPYRLGWLDPFSKRHTFLRVCFGIFGVDSSDKHPISNKEYPTEQGKKLRVSFFCAAFRRDSSLRSE